MCALRWDHPVCCKVSYFEEETDRVLLEAEKEKEQEKYDELASFEELDDLDNWAAHSSSTDNRGHWRGSSWYCWD